MTDVATPVTVFPKGAYASQIIGTRATFCTDADLINPSANVLAMPNCPVTVLNAGSFSVSPKFFGMSVLNRTNDALTGITANTTRSHDCANGIARWQYIETAPGVYGGFTNLDAWVNAHYAAGRDLVFTLFGTPTLNASYSARPTEQGAYGPSNLGIQAEPSDMTKWDNYCTALATRYKGKITHYEVWNEPNYANDGTGATGSTFFFSGTWTKLSEMVRRANQAIKAVDPTAKIICPPVQGWATTSNSSNTYFAGMMAASSGDVGNTPMKNWVDIIGVHLYTPTNLKDLPAIIDQVTAAKTAAGVSGLETWDTESAPFGATQQISSIKDPAGVLAICRRMIICAAKGVARSIYYQYDNTAMGFKDRQPIIRMREQVISDLLSGTVTGASMLNDGRVVYASRSGQIVL